jgi:signal transduction histidine kinase/PAS domain-containing protein
MKKTDVKVPSDTERRRLAEERLRAKRDHALRVEAAPHPERLIQELQIHQIELEMQNEELRVVRDELEVSLARSTDLYDFAPVGYVTVDAGSTVLEINLVGAAMLGKERSRIVGQSFAACVAAVGRPAFDAFLGELRDGADKASCEVALATHGDRRLHVVIDGVREPSGPGREWRCRAAMTDITQRNKMEERLKQQGARLALRYDLTSALSAAPTTAEVARAVFEKGLAAFGADAGALVMADEQDAGMLEVVAQFGYPDELIDAWQRFPATLATPVSEAYRTGAASWVESPAAAMSRFPAWAPAVASGSERAWAGLPLRVDGRTFGGLGLGFRHDRTFDDDDRAFIESLAERCAQALDRARLLESERAARARAEASEAAERVARREAERVGELQRLTLGVVGHDLRSPLQAIKMTTALLVQRGDLTPEQAERLLRIKRAGDRIGGIIRDLLDYTRARQGETLQIERNEVDLSALCRTIVLETQSIHPDRDITFESSDGCTGAWDSARLGQVVSNLLSNALQHGGPSCRVRVSLAAGEATATITVFNDGPPIPREAQAIIFEPYRRADAGERKKGSGLGLGLFITREIARAHGGDVTIDSAEGGTSFIVRLPRG